MWAVMRTIHIFQVRFVWIISNWVDSHFVWIGNCALNCAEEGCSVMLPEKLSSGEWNVRR